MPHRSLNNHRLMGHYHELQKYGDVYTSPVSSFLGEVINVNDAH